MALSADALLQCVNEIATFEPEPLSYVGGPRLGPRVMVLPRGVEAVLRSSKVHETKPLEGVHLFEEATLRNGNVSDAMVAKPVRINKRTTVE